MRSFGLCLGLSYDRVGLCVLLLRYVCYCTLCIVFDEVKREFYAFVVDVYASESPQVTAAATWSQSFILKKQTAASTTLQNK